SKLDIKIEATGDLKHHILEDVGICLGEAVRKALGDGTGINRFGYAIVPMDDALAISAVDLVTRPYAKIELAMNNDYVDNASGQELLHFLETFVMSLKATVHLQVQYGNNDHHKIEAAMKALSLSLKQAISQTPDKKYVPSAKGSV
ncbi:imidazoleglycerol-phosphate dehydratase, partial [Candidatus Bathyarchaeota archaeon]|nr:imidazoleglycerol-phosphate dehydratase [Candidatus Bathyarchaeota archaeon]